jgi:hypothetical protein
MNNTPTREELEHIPRVAQVVFFKTEKLFLATLSRELGYNSLTELILDTVRRDLGYTYDKNTDSIIPYTHLGEVPQFSIPLLEINSLINTPPYGNSTYLTFRISKTEFFYIRKAAQTRIPEFRPKKICERYSFPFYLRNILRKTFNYSVDRDGYITIPTKTC